MTKRAIKVARKEYPGFGDDEKRFGTEVAMYNAGFLKGDDNGKERGFRRAILLMSGRGGPWKPNERKWANDALTTPKKGRR